MKITTPSPLNTPQKSSPDANKTTAKRGSSSPTSAGDASALVDTPTGRDFASVLKEVSRPTQQQDAAGEKDGAAERRDAGGTAEGAERERETERHEDDGDAGRNGGGQMSQRGAFVREASNSIGETMSARAILHIADLERILAAVRTQTTLGGRREVTLELQRSVLEGLRVKLSTDDAGRVTAEFVAATERVRAQLDARSSDLADLLRSRGVDLAALRTSVGTSASEQHGAGGEQPDSQPTPRRVSTRTGDVRDGAAQAEADALPQNHNSLDSDSTYRA